MTTKQLRTRAVVKVTLQLDANEAWGPDCTMEQVMKQAKASVLDQLRQILKDTPGAKLVDEPLVTAVLVEEATL